MCQRLIIEKIMQEMWSDRHCKAGEGNEAGLIWTCHEEETVRDIRRGVDIAMELRAAFHCPVFPRACTHGKVYIF